MTTAATQSKPILFSDSMVRAILDGRKTQTRRVVKPQPSIEFENDPPEWFPRERLWGHTCANPTTIGDEPGEEWWRCPYGSPGDELWVRETFYRGSRSTLREWGDVEVYKTRDVQYAEERDGRGWLEPQQRTWMAKVPSIHMPRWASRLSLLIEDIRVERVQDIDIGNIKAEGVTWDESLACDGRAVDIDKFTRGWYGAWIDLWDSINSARGYSWESNPWVWVVKFSAIKSEVPA